MRVIDKNTDYYDYLQNSEDTIVFDRRGSNIITKTDFGDRLRFVMNIDRRDNTFPKEGFVLLQCGATYWLILITVSGMHKLHTYDSFESIADYSMEVLSTWKNYGRPRTSIKFEYIEFGYKLFNRIMTYKQRNNKKSFHEMLISHITVLQDAINNNDIFCRTTMFDNNPILTACGIKDMIRPEDIFMAIEEHFSLLKTESERIDPIGATNNDKIEMHGFDTKLSFRGNPK